MAKQDTGAGRGETSHPSGGDAETTRLFSTPLLWTQTDPGLYEVQCDMVEYMKRPGAAPRAPVEVGDIGEDEANATVKSFLAANWKKVVREPRGELKHPYVVPGAWYDNFWDWDSFFVGCAIPDDALDYVRGSVLNLVTAMDDTGKPPKMASGEGKYIRDAFPYPLQAQFAYLAARRMNDFAWLDPLWSNLIAIRRWYEKNTVSARGYFLWPDGNSSGLDNNPSVYGRPMMTSAGIDLAVWHYRDYRALERIGSRLGKDTHRYAETAEQLKAFIQSSYWDAVDRFFYNVDESPISKCGRQKVNWNVFLKFRSWASLFPLWGKVATASQAAGMLEKIEDPKEFWSICGIRSHSAADPIYNNLPMGGPSNWQGPVWALSTCVTAYGMAKYGYAAAAHEAVSRLLRTMAADIQRNECLHEFYHADTGQPVMKPGFLSWNMLCLRVLDDLRSGQDCTTGDLLD